MRMAAGVMALLLSACATPYQENSGIGGLLVGGVSATQIDSETVRVSGDGNSLTRDETIKNYVLLRAAEETKARGFDMFYVINQEDTSRDGVSINTLRPGEVSGGSYHAPGTDIVVKMLRGAAPTPKPPGLYVASEVIQYLGRAIGR